MADTQEATKGQMFGAIATLAVLGAAIYLAVTDHWQWLLIIPIGSAFVFGLAKFGWDAANAVEKKAKS